MSSWGYCGVVLHYAPCKPLATGRRRVTNQDRDDMIRLRRAGQSMDTIARVFGVHPGTVQYQLAKTLPESEHARLSLECKRAGRASITKTDRNAQIVAMRLRGTMLKDIARSFGVSKYVATEICLRYLPVEVTESLSLRKRWDLSDPVVQSGLHLFRSGLSIRAAAGRAGLPSACLWRAINKTEAIELGKKRG